MLTNQQVVHSIRMFTMTVPEDAFLTFRRDGAGCRIPLVVLPDTVTIPGGPVTVPVFGSTCIWI